MDLSLKSGRLAPVESNARGGLGVSEEYSLRGTACSRGTATHYPTGSTLSCGGTVSRASRDRQGPHTARVAQLAPRVRCDRPGAD